MHRQSLSSPSSKLHSNGIVGAKEDNPKVEEQKRKEQRDFPLPVAAGESYFDDDDDDEVRKSQKPQKSHSKPETLIHLIPILTFICFLILYLSSHDPSQKDLAQFNGFNRLSKLVDANEIDDFGRTLEVGKGDVLAIRSQRSLQEIDKRNRKTRAHRKIVDF